MNEELVALLLEQPFERVVEMAARQGMAIKYNPRVGDYYCEYPIHGGTCTPASQKTVKLAVARAVVSMAANDDHPSLLKKGERQ